MVIIQDKLNFVFLVYIIHFLTKTKKDNWSGMGFCVESSTQLRKYLSQPTPILDCYTRNSAVSKILLGLGESLGITCQSAGLGEQSAGWILAIFASLVRHSCGPNIAALGLDIRKHSPSVILGGALN